VRAILSVYDKTGIVDFARVLEGLGYELISTGGTEGLLREAGVDADARAYLVLRGYCGGAVKVEVDDPGDPTPYWLVSSRRPLQLAAALRPDSVQD
jgi:hypothetical protein